MGLRPSVQPSIDLLQTFLTVIRLRGNAAEAARVLNINQPSISKRLAFLRHANGVLQRPWLRREGKTWLLTDEGHRVLPVVGDLIERYRAVHGYTNASLQTPAGVLHLACGQAAGSFFIHRLLNQFHREHPNAEIRVSTMRTEQRIAAVASGAIDMALVARDNNSIRKLARDIPLRIENIRVFGHCLACGKNGPWSAKFNKLPRRKPLRLSVIANFPLIVPEPASFIRQILDPFVRSQRWAKSIEYRFEIGGWLTILEYVRCGLGVGLVSEMAMYHPDAKNLLFRTLSNSPLPKAPLKIITRATANEDDHPDRLQLADTVRKSLKRVLAK
jgi:DNA-binding transcriptional LysR family regulator